MLKANITMDDKSVLNDVILFTSQHLDDSVIESKEEAEKLLKEKRVLFFSGKYTQGGFSTPHISHYELLEDKEDIKEKLNKFIKDHNTFWDLEDTAEFIIAYRKDLLELLK